ncbi:hypothetical protein [Arthrobacter rhombi]|uniref:hypothetical protein n=1 Tax=Arthrobacter rhombi TaxID=71253 RepID=UPI003FD45FD7
MSTRAVQTPHVLATVEKLEAALGINLSEAMATPRDIAELANRWEAAESGAGLNNGGTPATKTNAVDLAKTSATAFPNALEQALDEVARQQALQALKSAGVASMIQERTKRALEDLRWDAFQLMAPHLDEQLAVLREHTAEGTDDLLDAEAAVLSGRNDEYLNVRNTMQTLALASTLVKTAHPVALFFTPPRGTEYEQSNIGSPGNAPDLSRQGQQANAGVWQVLRPGLEFDQRVVAALDPANGWSIGTSTDEADFEARQKPIEQALTIHVVDGRGRISAAQHRTWAP